MEVEVCSIGRDASNTVRIPDEQVSRFHAEIAMQGDALILRDLGSVNGTLVNQEPVESTMVHSGDQIRIGKTLLQVAAEQKSDSHRPKPDTDPVHESVGLTAGGSDTHLGTGVMVDSVKSNLQFLYNAALATSHTGERRKMCTRLLNLVFEWIDADRGCILLRNESGKKLVPIAVKYRDKFARKNRLTVSRTIVKYVAQNREGVLTANAQEDHRWPGEGSILKSGVHEAICVPIRGRSKLYGVIYADTLIRGRPSGERLRQFNPDHLKLMVAIGHQAAVAIESDEYYSVLVKSERLMAIGQTLTTLSHHIKNILQSINGGSHLVEAGLDAQNIETIEQGWGIVVGNQQRLSHLVMDMLNYSKPRRPNRRPFDVSKLLSKALEGQRTLAQRQGIEIVLHPIDSGLTFYGDEVAITTAVENVIIHAIPIGHTVENGQIHVAAEVVEGNLRLEIADNFQTASETELDSIFKPFAVEDESEVRGISLAVSRKIVREHDGAIYVRPLPEAGLKFVIELPVGEIGMEESETIEAVKSAGRSRSG